MNNKGAILPDAEPKQNNDLAVAADHSRPDCARALKVRDYRIAIPRSFHC